MNSQKIASLSKMKKLTFASISLFISMVFILFITEIGIRIFMPQKLYQTPQYMHIADPAIGYKLNPGYKGYYNTNEYNTLININSYGLRGDEIKSKKEGVYRILGLGDSMTFGGEVEWKKTYLRILEDNLNTSLENRAFEVLNAGVFGYGTDHELALLNQIGEQLVPDLVLLGFYVGNDVNDNLIGKNVGNLLYRTVKDGHLVTVDEEGRTLRLPNFIRSPLRKHSHSYYFFKNRFQVFLNRYRTRSGPAIYAKNYDTDLIQGWKYTFELIDNMSQWCKTRNVSFAVVILSDRLQVYQHLFESYQVDIELYDLEKPTRLVKEYCQNSAIPFFNTLPSLRDQYDSTESEDLYFAIDNHLNEKGTATVGNGLANFLKDSKLLNQ